MADYADYLGGVVAGNYGDAVDAVCVEAFDRFGHGVIGVEGMSD